MFNPVNALILLLLLSSAHLPTAQKPKIKKRKLERSDGKRWQIMNEVVKAQITSQTQKFLQTRGQSLFIPINVDLLLLGFDSDGAFHFEMGEEEFLTTLTQSHGSICPTIWDTGEKAAVCFNVNYEVLTTPDSGLGQYEKAVRNMLLQTNASSQEVPRDGMSKTQVPVYDVEASGVIEDTLQHILDAAYLEDGISPPGDPKSLSDHRLSVILLNPSKIRMSPLMSEGDAALLANMHGNFVDEWANGQLHEEDLVAQEGGFVYRYMYNHRGSAGSWVSSRNFIVVDLSAGPSDYGPLATPNGHVTPSELPRIMPMLIKMERDIEAHNEPGTLRQHLINEAKEGQHIMLMGALSEMVSSATHHIFCPDIKMDRIEHAAQILVPIIAIHDDENFDAVSGGHDADKGNGSSYTLDLGAVQSAMEMMIDSKQYAVQEVQTVMLHHHRNVATALHKAKVTRSTTVLGNLKGEGIMRTQQVHLDSEVLLRELLMASPMLSDGVLDIIDPEEMDMMIENELSQHVRHRGTRVLPVFILSLSGAPDQLLLDHNQLFAANRDAVVVMQMKPPDGGSADVHDDNYGFVYTRHMLNGKHLKLHAAAGVTSNVIAGLAMSLAGIVPPYERYNEYQQAITQDWRWTHGAMPWGPYSNATAMSTIFAGTARRNVFVSHLEAALLIIQNRLDEVDAFVGGNFEGPFSFLGETVAFKEPRHWLNVLSNSSHGYNESFTPDVAQRLERNLQDVEALIEKMSWSIYAHDFDEAENELPALLAAVDLFSKHVKQDLELAADTMTCCQLHQTAAGIDNLFIAIFVIVFCVSILLISLVWIFFTTQKGRRPKLQLGPTELRTLSGGPSRWPSLTKQSSGPASPHSWQQASSPSLKQSPRHLNV